MKIIFKFTAIILLFALVFPHLYVFAREDIFGYELTQISAKSACLIDFQSKKVLYSKGDRLRMPMASTTKIMTALIALESGIPLDKIVSVPKEAVGIEGSSIYLSEGERISFEALIYALLLSSANDAAVAIAHTVCGNVCDFVDLMNKKAASLGLTDTHFTNPHGLYDEEHYTTAYELAVLMAHCMENESFAKICGTQKAVFPRESEGVRVLINHNKLLRENGYVIGGKTGFTKKSGRCLVTCAEEKGLKLICVTLNAPDDWNDHKKLYDFAYSSYESLELEAQEMEIPVISGRKSSVLVRSESLQSVLIAKGYAELEVTIEAPRFIFASVENGEQIGRVVYRYGENVIATSPLIATESVQKTKYRFSLIDWLKQLFGIQG